MSWDSKQTLLFLGFAVSYYFLIDIPHSTDLFFVLACLLALLFNLSHPNIVTWVLIVMVMRGIELVTFLLFGDFIRLNPLLHYSIQIGLDIMAILLINKRWYYYYRYWPRAKKEDAYFTNADLYLILIYAGYLLVGVLSMIESIIRSPSRIGLPQEWGNPDFLLVYNNFEYLKAGLSIFLIGALLGSITEYFKRSRQFLNA